MIPRDPSLSLVASVEDDRTLLDEAVHAYGIKGNTTISVCLPARNEEETIGAIVESIRVHLMESIPLVDELIVLDDNSSDATARVAHDAGARVVPEKKILPTVGSGSGKGNVLWKSLYACHGDIICWLDADVRNFSPSFVNRLVMPLLEYSDLALTKGYYRRPLEEKPSGGGRVTELMARPLLSLLFPKLADVVQPLAGEYAGRRDVLETVPFVQGWGVEIGLLLDITHRNGRESISQVDLGTREHRNRSLSELSEQALAILVTVLRRAGIAEIPDSMIELCRFDENHQPAIAEVEVRERPPMITIEEYKTLA